LDRKTVQSPNVFLGRQPNRPPHGLRAWHSGNHARVRRAVCLFRGKVHNVMEPAAWAKPITVGPHYGNSPEAVGMVESGAISAVSSAPGLAAVLGAWMSDPVRASTQGSAARDFLTARLGASERIADAIDAAIEAGPR
ncbi:MAG: hypothetical protein MUE60_11045, partial [Candidatus Eisenbacteria bacterium]|nr:hypothetical protein [Candidatus Eisenbacteria bacterium]